MSALLRRDSCHPGGLHVAGGGFRSAAVRLVLAAAVSVLVNLASRNFLISFIAVSAYSLSVSC
ncbi:hypothetical protein QJS66_22020 [Kocuria rhizophila]|nr:hypothetical protein QJS66_22020 [Kocuria rhizophila]